MCTVVVLHRPNHAWPVILLANRDERIDRPWDPPAAHWPDQPDVTAGRDRLAGGTWMGVNATLTAAVLNRPGQLGPMAGKRSRGELPLMALAHATAAAGAQAIARENAGAWRGFNLVIADRDGAFFLNGLEAPRLLPPGVSMITAFDPNARESPRVARHLPRFQAAAEPAPDSWDAWRAILSDRSGGELEQLNVRPRHGFGTVCSSFLAIPRDGAPVWLFAAGAPHEAPFIPVPVATPAGSAAFPP